MAAINSKFRHKVVPHTDKRIALTNELISSIRLIKMYAWEEPFAAKITAVRKEEVGGHQKVAFFTSAASTISPSITIMASVVTFLALTMDGYELTAAEAFTVFSIFTALQFSVGTLPYSIRYFRLS